MFVVVMVGTSSSSSRGIERVVSRDVWMELFWRYGISSERKNWVEMGGPTLPVQNPRSTCSGETALSGLIMGSSKCSSTSRILTYLE